MITSRVTPPAKEEGVEMDEAEGVGGATDSNRLERNYTSLHLMVMASSTHNMEVVEQGKGNRKVA